jgi:DNA polymerase III alpha subunit (gram-positive type)
MSEFFLDMSNPNSGREEARLKSEGYIEKKYTRSTAKEIEDAFKRYLLKQIITQRGLTTPAQINALQKEINPMVQETMYEKGKNGAKVFKFKMFLPSAKLIKEREAAMMITNNNNAIFNEEFAPENYAKNLESVNKAQKLALNVQNSLSRLRTKRSLENVQKALNKTRKAQNKLAELAVNVKNTPNFVAKVKKAQNNAAKTRRNLEVLYEAEVKPINDISAMLRNVHLNTYKFSPIKPSGQLQVNETFIESILELKNTKNNNNNNRNTNKISTKALISGLLASEIRFIRDVVNALIANGMNTDMAIRAGVILANLPQRELKEIQKEAAKASGITPDFLMQLVQYLGTK